MARNCYGSRRSAKKWPKCRNQARVMNNRERGKRALPGDLFLTHLWGFLDFALLFPVFQEICWKVQKRCKASENKQKPRNPHQLVREYLTGLQWGWCEGKVWSVSKRIQNSLCDFLTMASRQALITKARFRCAQSSKNLGRLYPRKRITARWTRSELTFIIWNHVLDFATTKQSPGKHDAVENTMRPELITQMIRKQFFCATDVCNRQINSQTFNVCNWRIHRKYLMKGPNYTK